MRRLARTSVGKKSITAASGLLLFGFLLSHVGGNALPLAPDGGASYNAYAARLKSFGPLLWVARTGLATLFAVHILLALRISAENRRARAQHYRAPTQSTAVPSFPRPMLATGLIVAAFLVAHLWHFSFDARFATEGAGLVQRTLRDRSVIALYAAGIAGLWVHLWYALPSALQTLGAMHPRWSPALRRACRIAVSVVCALFLTILGTLSLG